KTNQKFEKKLEFEKHANKIESLVEELDNNKTTLLDFVEDLLKK
ncbi:12660_t:CDS:2, partial [Entrophospora sp. SA101]